jgi:hypothetical protein
MSKWPMRGHFRYLRFKTFPMTPRTLQCEVFWALLSNSKHSGVPEDYKSPTLEVLGFTPTLGQSGVATLTCIQSYKTIISNLFHDHNDQTHISELVAYDKTFSSFHMYPKKCIIPTMCLKQKGSHTTPQTSPLAYKSLNFTCLNK